MNNKLPQISFVYDRHKTASETRKASIEIRIAYDYKRTYISTGIMLYPHQWKNSTITDCPDIIEISQSMDKLLKDIRQIVYDMMQEGHIDIFSISPRLKERRQDSTDFIAFCRQRAEIRKYGKKQDTQERYDRFLRLFEEWGKIRCFRDITDHSIIAYDRYLTDTGMKPYSKWNNYHRFLDGFIKDAMNEGYLNRNPYKWINIEKDKVSLGIEKCLTFSEFRKLKSTKMPTESLSRVRDLFIFQTYTCLRYSDLARFDSSQIVFVGKTRVYKCMQQKTNKPAIIPLLQPALDILDRYQGKLPIISNVKYNEYLKVVAQASGIDKPLSTHWARHTGATILLNEGVDLKIVSKICGHSSIRMTEQVYAKLLDETVVEAVSGLDI